MKLVHFVVNRRFFDLLLSGAKHAEFRAITPHWRARLRDVMAGGVAEFRNGYRKDAPRFRRHIEMVEEVPATQMQDDELLQVLGRRDDNRVFAVRLGPLAGRPKRQ